MGSILTAAGESLLARLQAEGRPLIIDRFIFARIDVDNPSDPPPLAQTMPADVVYTAVIPPEYRAFINENEVVYSALLGSDIGDFSFNWQGLYCSEYDVVVAVATFPVQKKRAYDAGSNTAGNNLNRNFILKYSGVQEITGITIEAAVWQLDFTVRLKGIDERERLSNRDIYGRAAFLDDGWRVVLRDGDYTLLPGVGYVEGIRAALDQAMPVYPDSFPCDVYLDVCMEPQGSDVVTVAQVLCLPAGDGRADYVTAAPHNVRHFCELIAHIPAAGAEPENKRGGWPLARRITVTYPLKGGGTLDKDISIGLESYRKIITEPLTLYVRANGNNNNDGLEVGSAWKDPLEAIYYINNKIDIASACVTLDIGSGTFDWDYSMPLAPVSSGRGGEARNAAPYSVRVIGAGQGATVLRDGLQVSGITAYIGNIKTIPAGGRLVNAIAAKNGAMLVCTDVSCELNDTGSNLIGGFLAEGSTLSLAGTTKISGTKASSAIAGIYHATVSVTGAFQCLNASQSIGQVLRAVQNTYFLLRASLTGSCIGSKYAISGNSGMDTAGTYNSIPGNAAGTVSATTNCWLT